MDQASGTWRAWPIFDDFQLTSGGFAVKFDLDEQHLGVRGGYQVERGVGTGRANALVTPRLQPLDRTSLIPGAFTVAHTMSLAQKVLQKLGKYRLDKELVITSVGEDRVWAWPTSDRILLFMLANGWRKDPHVASTFFHGSAISFREPVAFNALQITIHPVPIRDREKYPWSYFLEIDIDEGNPHSLPGLFVHAWQLIRNFFKKLKQK